MSDNGGGSAVVFVGMGLAYVFAEFLAAAAIAAVLGMVLGAVMVVIILVAGVRWLITTPDKPKNVWAWFVFVVGGSTIISVLLAAVYFTIVYVVLGGDLDHQSSVDLSFGQLIAGFLCSVTFWIVMPVSVVCFWTYCCELEP